METRHTKQPVIELESVIKEDIKWALYEKSSILRSIKNSENSP